VGVYSGTLKNF